MQPSERFDVITMLATLEHLPDQDLQQLAEDCASFLEPHGYLITTVPSRRADLLLTTLKSLKVIDGMSLHEHHGFEPSDTPSIFKEPNFTLIKHKTFQLGLNNLFVFMKKTNE